jgi:acyl-CoA thioesterase-1
MKSRWWLQALHPHRLLTLMLAGFVIMGLTPARGVATPASLAPDFRLMVLGDSLSASYGIAQQSGWVAQLAERLQQQGYPVQVINAAISGDTTAGGRSRLGAALAKHQPDLLLLELGGNDGLQGLPVNAMQQNLTNMIDQAYAAGADVLLLGIKVPPNYGRRYTQAFEQVFVDVAKEKNVPLVPFILQDVANHTALMQGDGIHPTADAQRQILENIWPTLVPLLPAPAP